MKNIILIDRPCEHIDYVIQSKEYFIVVLIVENIKQQEQYSKFDCIKHILTIEEMNKLDHVKKINYDLIEEFRPTQRKIEFAMHRFIIDGAQLSYIYYNALSFWKEVFDNNKINFIISYTIEHGLVYDTLPLEMAVKNNIQAYTISVSYTNCYWIYHLNTKEPLELIGNKFDYDTVKKNKCCSAVHNKNKELSFKDKLINTNVMFAQFILMFLRGSTKQEVPGTGLEFDYFTKLKHYFVIGKMNRYYNKISIEPDFTKKYVFYALHFEPEAVTNVTSQLQNQLTIIKMISDAIPRGWKIYVKEHPSQFKLNNLNFHYFILNLIYYKNLWFYKKLKSMSNVELINLNAPSAELIENSMVVATINGTVGLESVLINKPLLHFEQNHTLLKLIKNLDQIRCYSDVKKYFKKFETNPPILYQGLEQLAKYTFNKDDSYLNIIYNSINK
ncbi:hypothetical protein OAQ99_07225 [Candidatus Kapabacteria bacterium]|nr:hypothetical protein [Candidatus Kapabacteria bacterium]